MLTFSSRPQTKQFIKTENHKKIQQTDQLFDQINSSRDLLMFHKSSLYQDRISFPVFRFDHRKTTQVEVFFCEKESSRSYFIMICFE